MHFSKASGQRSRKRHPRGGWSSRGGLPGMPVSRRSAQRTPTRGRDEMSICVYGCRGCTDDRLRRALFRQLACIHDHDGVGNLIQDRQIVGDDHHAVAAVAIAELDQQAGHRLLRSHIQRRGDLVGNEQRRVEHARDHHDHALLHPARELDRVQLQHVARQAAPGPAGAGSPATSSRDRHAATAATPPS